MAKPAPSRLDNVIALAKRRGFVYPCGEIYGGTRSAWDYGPLGVELKENIKRQWWKYMVTSRDDVVGLDSSIILPKNVWVASGHVGVFTDPLTECLSCHKRFRVDQMQEEYAERKGIEDPDSVELTELPCPNCGTHNTPGAVRCSHCGCPLPKAGEEAPGAAPQKPQDQGPIYARNPGDVNPGGAPRNDRAAPGPHIDTYSAGPDGIQRREIGPEDPIEGIKAKDWAAFVGRSPMYYLMQFFRMSETKQKVTLSLSAFLFGPAYLFYRKMWKQGLLATLVMVVLSIPGFMSIIATFNPTFFGSLPLGWLPAAYTIGEIGIWAFKVILGMFAVSWYHDSSKAQIEEIYMACPEGDGRTELLVQRGGTNLLAALLYFGIMCLLQVAILYMAGPSAIQYLMTMAGA